MATRWAVPRMWTGKTAVVLAGGESLKQQSLLPLRSAAASTKVIVVNNSFRLWPEADMLYAADADWWRHNAQEALRFPGLKVTSHDCCEFRAVHLLQRTGTEGFDADPSCVRTGGNSGYQAIHTAIHAGADRILLLGFDMHGSHWFGQHEAPLMNPSQVNFDEWTPRFEALIGRGSEIVNCTPGSTLTCFRSSQLVDEV